MITRRVMQTGPIVVLAGYLRRLTNTVGGSDVSRYRYGADVRLPVSPARQTSTGVEGAI